VQFGAGHTSASHVVADVAHQVKDAQAQARISSRLLRKQEAKRQQIAANGFDYNFAGFSEAAEA
jgi:hypothetical protein